MADSKPVPIKPIAAVERALLVLEVFRRQRGPLTFMEITSATGLLKTTVFRILHTLQHAGYIIRLPDGRFQLDAIFMQFGVAYQQSFRLDDHIPPLLEQLAKLTHESASFYVRQGTQRVCLYRVESQQLVRDVVPAGTVLPIDDTAASIILREYEHLKDIQKALCEDYPQMLHETVGKGPTPEVASISAPVLNYGGLLGAVSVTGPKERFTPARFSTMRDILRQEVHALSARLCGMAVPAAPLEAKTCAQTG